MQKPKAVKAPRAVRKPSERYVLEAQIGYLLRQVSQRHFVIFTELMGEDITPTQWAALTKLAAVGPTSQNLLGRLTSMDAATIKGVVQRLAQRGLVATSADDSDARRLIAQLTSDGARLVEALTPRAMATSQVTLMPLSPREAEELIRLLTKLR